MRLLKVLIVEDNAADARLQQFALGAQVFDCEVTWMDSIDSALDLLNGQVERIGRADPDVILLDGQVGAEDAAEMLIVLKLDEALKNLPVVVMTGSNDPNRHAGWVAQGAEWVMQKCFEIEDLESGMAALERYAREM